MLYTQGKIDTGLAFNAYKGVKREHSKTLPSLKSLDKDKCCFSGIKNISHINNVSFSGNKQLTAHDNPYVLVHGTIVKEDSMFSLRDFLQPKVPNLDVQYYPNITNGKKMEDCGRDVSRNVNRVRIDTTKEKLNDLKKIKDNPEKLRAHFGINQGLCQNKCDTEQIVRLLPDVITEIEGITKRGKKDLQDSFSTRVKAVELKLADQLQQTDFGNWDKANKENICKKAAAAILDGIAPKAVLVGLSMGGLVAHIMAVNPKEVAFDEKGQLKDQSKFTYDAANGIAIYSSLGAPVENGTDMDSAGMKEARFDWCDETMLRPIEKFWGGLLSLCPPWLVGKAIFKYNAIDFSLKNDIKPLSDPAHLKEKPALVQMTRNSDFLKEYVIGKHAPAGVSNLSYYHPDDKFMDIDCVKLNEDHANNHNIRVNFDITDEVVNKARSDLSVGEAMIATMKMLYGLGINLKKGQEMIKSLYAHEVVPLEPQEFLKSFENTILTDSRAAARMLEESNSDTLRCQCLDVIYNQVQKDPAYLNDKPELLAKIKQVCAENIPFESSPSYKAAQILK
ncbi:MAG: hypothetical protein AB1782_00540 [Cyanobacteriota bacterium]